MKRKNVLIVLVLLVALLFTGCSNEEQYTINSTKINTIKENNKNSIDTSYLKETDIELKNDTKTVITETGTYKLNGSTNSAVTIDTESSVILILDNVLINTTDSPSIICKKANKLKIKIVGENTLTDNLSETNATNNETDETDNDLKGVIYSNSNIVLTGDGTLTINANRNHGVVSERAVSIENEGVLNIVSVSDGINAESVVIKDGIIDINSTNEGIETSDTIEILESAKTIHIKSVSNGIKSEGVGTFNGGEITIESNSEGIESKDALIFNGTSVNIVSVDDSVNAFNKIEFNDCFFNGKSTNNDCVDSNGTIEVNGGFVYTIGSNTPNSGIDCDNNSFIINGGTVISLGGTVTAPDTNSKQSSVVYGNVKNGDVIELRTSENVLTSIDIKEDADTFLLSSSLLNNGTQDLDIFFVLNDSEVSEKLDTNEILNNIGDVKIGMQGGMRPDFKEGIENKDFSKEPPMDFSEERPEQEKLNNETGKFERKEDSLPIKE